MQACIDSGMPTAKVPASAPRRHAGRQSRAARYGSPASRDARLRALAGAPVDRTNARATTALPITKPPIAAARKSNDAAVRR
jgi:hypothetical protein